MTTFEEFELDPLILKALEKMEYKEPSPIQAETIPIIKNRQDLIGLARTGSGKTAACAIPVCDRVNVAFTYVQALIIVPTRELALQYATEVQKIGSFKQVKAFAIYGGEDAAMQQSKLKHGVQVLVATPGRLIDFIYSRSIDLSHVETLILDEADEMLSMGFYDDLEFVIQCLVHEHQTLLFSATMPEQIRKIAKNHMKSPLEINLITEEASPVNIDHKFVYCRHHQRDQALIELIHDMKPKQCIVFCHSRIQCEKVCIALQKNIHDVEYFHAGLNQNIRTIITSKFRSGRIRVLVATDIAARGLDFSEVSHVFIYQLSDDADVYVHRSGRTGRQQRQGTVVTLVTDRELSHLKQILGRINREVDWIGEPPVEGKKLEAPKHKHRPPQRRRGPEAPR
jgi:ATP-dependent RNA helicase DeaD